MRPLLLRSPLTGAVYVATKYTVHEGGLVEAHTKYDVTQQFDDLAAGRDGSPVRVRLERLGDVEADEYRGRADAALDAHAERGEA